ncbi:hypothetical protein AX16_009971 [Volvariella volvacea WC 439]|nr:hypothetical protein AX16_009971 [Volvariella volvacea WC 439]
MFMYDLSMESKSQNPTDIIRFPFISLPPFHADAEDEAEDVDAPAAIISPSAALDNERRAQANQPRACHPSESKAYKCKHYPQSQRLFTFSSVKSHVQLKHRVAQPGTNDRTKI